VASLPLGARSFVAFDASNHVNSLGIAGIVGLEFKAFCSREKYDIWCFFTQMTGFPQKNPAEISYGWFLARHQQI